MHWQWGVGVGSQVECGCYNSKMDPIQFCFMWVFRAGLAIL